MIVRAIVSGETVSSSVFECSNGMVELSDVGTSPVETFCSAVLCTVTGGDDGAESSARCVSEREWFALTSCTRSAAYSL